ncbi:MAG: SAV_2336 N-terminal domain-related protein [Crocosphaera sp.]|nr:SAV_2336 N-terminal domain-related protein [Crocosphaera sp.]
MLAELVSFIHQEKWDLDAMQIAEALWFMQKVSVLIPEIKESEHPEKTSEAEDVREDNKKSPNEKFSDNKIANLEPERKFPITQLSHESSPLPKTENISSPLDELPIKLPDTGIFQNTLKLGRLAKLLKEKIDSRITKQLDIKKTVKLSAELSTSQFPCYFPVLTPKKERWLDVALIIEDSQSLILWQSLIGEVQKFLEHLGAFRDIKSYRMNWDNSVQNSLQIYPFHSPFSSSHLKASNDKPFNSVSNSLSPQQFNVPDGRRLILIVSDCISPAWLDNKFINILGEWSAKGLLTLLHPFPERMWERTNLDYAIKIRLGNQKKGIPTQKWLATPLESWQVKGITEKTQKTLVKLPILSLESESMSAWVNVMMGKGKSWCAGVWLGSNFMYPKNDDNDDEIPDSLQQINNFYVTSSQLAWQLIQWLSAIPVSLATIRLVQRTLLPESTQVNVAEVVMGGLLSPVKPLNSYKSPHQIQFEFKPGIREAFLERLGEEEFCLGVIGSLTEKIASHFGYQTIREFEATLLTNPLELTRDENLQLIQAFATISVSTLRQYGEAYAPYIQKLDRSRARLNLVSAIEGNSIGFNWIDFLESTAQKYHLTEIEIETLINLLPTPTQSYSIREVAKQLIISPSAISRRLTNIYRKFEALNPNLFQSKKHNKLSILQLYLYSQYVKVRLLHQSAIPAHAIPQLETLDLFEFEAEVATIVFEPVLEPRYHRLDELLKNQQFKEADQETYRLIFETVGKIRFDEKDIQSLSCDILLTINSLWEQYSQGKFGFRKQIEICQTLGGIKDKFDRLFWYQFREKVNWPVPDIIDPLDQVPPGHLPHELLIAFRESAVLSRFMTCEQELSNLNIKTEKKLQQWTFETPTVNRHGEIIKTTTHTASYFTEPLTDNVILEMVSIPGGTFTMGSPENEKDSYDDERPQHNVTLSSFFMGKYPITQAQWKAIASRTDLKVNIDLDEEPSHFKGDNRPVEQVNWYEAVEFCQRLSKLTGRDYQLPSEAQWEYACRAVTEPLDLEKGESYPPFYFGETITDKLANYDASNTYAEEPKGESRGETTPVGQFPANPFGLYDMHGNVWEWCADDWHDNYNGAPNDGSAWMEFGTSYLAKNKQNESDFLLRGGSWGRNPYNCRSAYRLNDFPRVYHRVNLGFRVVCLFGRTE